MKKYNLLLMLVLLGILAACASKDTGPQVQVQPRIAHLEKRSAQVNVDVNPEEIPPGKSPEDLLRQKAAQRGMAEVLGVWLRDKYLFAVGNNTLWNDDVHFLDVGGSFKARQDELTRSYSQLFRIEVALAPVTQAEGEIDALEDKLGMGGQGHYCTIRLGELCPRQNAYFLVCRDYPVQDQSGYVQSIAYGKIYNVIDGLAQGIVLQSAKEVEKGDHVFLLQTRVSPVLGGEPGPSDAGLQEVVVEPKMREQDLKGPAESK